MRNTHHATPFYIHPGNRAGLGSSHGVGAAPFVFPPDELLRLPKEIILVPPRNHRYPRNSDANLNVEL
jgi:hypothetical protein